MASKSSSPTVSFHDLDLKLRLQRSATLERRTLSQMTKLLLEEVLPKIEKEKNLPSIDEDEAA